MRWWARLWPVLIGCTAGAFGSKLIDGEPMTGRTFVVWLALTMVALVVTWLAYWSLDKARRDSNPRVGHPQVPGPPEDR